MNIITKADRRRRRVAAIGMWDGLHLGHRFLIDYLLLEARNRGLTPAVVTFSDHPKRVVDPEKAPMMLSTLTDRVDALGAQGVVDIILLSFNERMRRQSARKFLERLKKSFGVDTLVVGFNNRFGHDRADGLKEYQAIGNEIGLEVVAAPEYRNPDNQTISSSTIREHVAAGRVEEAGRLLGHPYGLRGIVVEGKHLGRTMGFPTANLRPSATNILIPGTGVYATYVTTPDGKRRPAVVNIGFRPTVDNPELSSPELSIEIHIPGFTGYLYDDELLVEFMHRLRDEQRFKDINQLRKAIGLDVSDTLRRLAADIK